MNRLTFLLLTPLLFHSIMSSSQPFQLKTDHQALVVSDLDRSVEFYTSLGLMEIENKTQNATIRWMGLNDGREIHLIQRSKDGIQVIKSLHMALCVDNLDGYMTYLKEENIAFENWPGASTTTNTRPDGIRQIYIQDPDGYWIEINDVKR